MNTNNKIEMSRDNGFLFEVKNIKTDEVKGYFFGAPHIADKEMLLSLQNEKITKVFNQSKTLFVENAETYLTDFDKEKDQEKTTYKNFSKKIKEMDNSGNDFSTMTHFPPGFLDGPSGMTKPGVDFHLLAEAFENNKKIISLEEDGDSNQSKALLDDQLIEKYRNNLIGLISDHPQHINKLLSVVKATSTDKPTSEKESTVKPVLKEEDKINMLMALVTKRNEFWKIGNKEDFISVMKELEEGFHENLILFDKFTFEIADAQDKIGNNYDLALCNFIIKEKDLKEIQNPLAIIHHAAIKANSTQNGDWMQNAHEDIKENLIGKEDILNDMKTLFDTFDSLKNIAFQRNREINLSIKVDEFLNFSSKPQFFVFGTSHLASTHNLNLISMLEEKGWKITQMK